MAHHSLSDGEDALASVMESAYMRDVLAGQAPLGLPRTEHARRAVQFVKMLQERGYDVVKRP